MLFEKYQHKIKTLAELKEIVGDFPRKKKVAMCHGVFDIVHPGHMRHLAYVREKVKAGLLVVSLTADRHINKGKYRPHVPQELRAANLAAFEMVDFVLIDKNAKPLETLATLQPDFFAKGYEYVANGLPEKTTEENELISAYGGKILFTPGDIVYSSSHLINSALPSIRYEKLSTLMETKKIHFKHLNQALDKLKGIKVHVIGDTIIDGFMQTTMIGGQTKTPTMSVLYESQENYLGGAGIVAQHLRAAGANVTLTTLLGNDTLGQFALEQLNASGVHTNAIIDDNRPTVHKNAIIANGYRLLKVDTLDNSSINGNILNQFIQAIKTTECDAIIFSDFRHGIFNRGTIPALMQAIPEGCFKVADSQVASRWGNITEFKGFDLITPNEREARFALADQDSGIRPLASSLYDEAQCNTLILKLGARGILTCCSADHESLDSLVILDSFVNELKDAVGAGDALLAYATLALVAEQSPVIASILGSLAAACECEYDGNIPICTADLVNKIDSIKKNMAYLDIPKTNSANMEETTLIEA